MQKNRYVGRRTGAALAVAFAALAFTACTTTLPSGSATPAEQRANINEGADATLKRLYQTVPGSRDYVQRARGVLVFPEAVSGGFIVGVEHGKGVLRVGGQHAGYYSTSSGSFGLQAGAQSRSIIILFMTQEALDGFRNSSGWTAGVDATVAVATVGATGHIDTNTVKEPVVAFALTNAGLMAGVSLEGAKIVRLDL
ncbi:twin-arginine translocation pathway signal [Alcaligenaceae bacterium]|nr:twin-arginine translocation pathway signal [Alcaligenaceae bacterium]